MIACDIPGGEDGADEGSSENGCAFSKLDHKWEVTTRSGPLTLAEIELVVQPA